MIPAQKACQIRTRTVFDPRMDILYSHPTQDAPRRITAAASSLCSSVSMPKRTIELFGRQEKFLAVRMAAESKPVFFDFN